MSTRTVKYLWPISYKIWLCVLVAPRRFRINRAGSNQSRSPRMYVWCCEDTGQTQDFQCPVHPSQVTMAIYFLLIQFPWRTSVFDSSFCISLERHLECPRWICGTEWIFLHSGMFNSDSDFKFVQRWLLKILQLCHICYIKFTNETNKPKQTTRKF